MKNIADVARATHYLTSKHVFDSVCWKEMQDHGNPCVNWLKLSPADRLEYADTRRQLDVIMPLYSQRYQIIYEYMRQYFNKQWLSRDFFMKLLARALMCETFVDFKKAIEIAQTYQEVLAQRSE